MKCGNEYCGSWSKQQPSRCDKFTNPTNLKCVNFLLVGSPYKPAESKPSQELDQMGKLVAGKLLLAGISKSLLKRDGKTLVEIMDSLESRCVDSNVATADLIAVSKLTIAQMFDKQEN